MIQIQITKNKDDVISEFRIDGHANFEDTGKDIVCAAVSILAYNTISCLEDIVGINVEHADIKGHLECNINSEDLNEPEVKLLLDSMVHGFSVLAYEYPKHVKLVIH